MALFDLLKKASKIVTELAAEQAQSGTASVQKNTAPVAPAAPASVQAPSDFDRIIRENFPADSYKKDFPASALDPAAHPACKNVDYMFLKDGVPALAVVLVKKNTARGMNVIGTKNICENAGIPYMRFYLEMPNRDDYVCDRIRAAL